MHNPSHFSQKKKMVKEVRSRVESETFILWNSVVGGINAYFCISLSTMEAWAHCLKNNNSIAVWFVPNRIVTDSGILQRILGWVKE